MCENTSDKNTLKMIQEIMGHSNDAVSLYFGGKKAMTYLFCFFDNKSILIIVKIITNANFQRIVDNYPKIKI